MPTRTEALFIRAYGRGPSGRKLINSIGTRKLQAVGPDFAAECEVSKLVTYFYPNFYRVTPRGLDLLATADFADFDPATVLDPTPEPVACGACENGRVMISRGGLAVDPDEEIEMTARCEACGGSGEAKTPWRFAEIIEAEQARTRDAKPMWDNSALGLQRTNAEDGEKSIHVDTKVLTVSLIDPDGWTTDRDGIHTLLLRAEAKGLEVEVKHPRYDPGPSKVRVKGLGNGECECWVVLRPADGGFATQLLYASDTFETITAVRIHDPWTRDPSAMDALFAHACEQGLQVVAKVEAPEGSAFSAASVEGRVSHFTHDNWTIGTTINWAVTTRADVPAVLRATAVRFKGVQA